MNQFDIIGRAEQVDLPDLGLANVPAKIDTGAYSSAIWASQITVKDDGLYCVFFDKGNPHYTGKIVRVAKDYSITRVANSFGQKQLRYKIKLRLRVKGRLLRATFTLSDRSQQTYPILLGRRLLKGKFLVDVSKGDALANVESIKAQRLLDDLQRLHSKESQS